jgi:hypothetical protein
MSDLSARSSGRPLNILMTRSVHDIIDFHVGKKVFDLKDSDVHQTLKISLKLGHISTSTRPSAMALPGSRGSWAVNSWFPFIDGVVYKANAKR